MEVATARVYNWDVTMKRKEKNDQDAIEDTGKNGSPNGWGANITGRKKTKKEIQILNCSLDLWYISYYSQTYPSEKRQNTPKAGITPFWPRCLLISQPRLVSRTQKSKKSSQRH